MKSLVSIYIDQKELLATNKLTKILRSQ